MLVSVVVLCAVAVVVVDVSLLLSSLAFLSRPPCMRG